MIVVNQRVADEIATLVARHRYAVEDSKDAVKAAEAASAQRNQELREEAEKKRAELVAKGEQLREQADAAQKKNAWTNQSRKDDHEISLGGEDDYEVEQESAARAPVPPPPAAPVPVPPAPRAAPRRQAYDDFDDDFENQSWLR